MKAGVAINPHTNESLLTDIIKVADYILVMSVNPGFGGQSYIPYITQKIFATIDNNKSAINIFTIVFY